MTEILYGASHSMQGSHIDIYLSNGEALTVDAAPWSARDVDRGAMPFDLYCKLLIVVRVDGQVRHLEVVSKERATRHGTEDWQAFVHEWAS